MSQSDRQAEPSQEYPASQSNVHCPGTSDRCHEPETDCEVALDDAFGTHVPGSIPEQTSAMQASPEGTNPETHDAVSSPKERFPKEQETSADTVP
jgi:hypothetical protein